MSRGLVSQLARPRGLIGWEVRREMASANAAMIQGGIEMLEVRPGDRVAEIGFGNPTSLAQLLDQASPGVVIGVDHSPHVVRAAKRRLKSHVEAGRLRVVEATAEALPLEDESVDRLLAVNTVTYWPDLDAGIQQLARVASKSARLVIGVRAPHLLLRLGIAGSSVHHLDQDELTELGLRHGWVLDSTSADADRTGEYILARLRR